MKTLNVSFFTTLFLGLLVGASLLLTACDPKDDPIPTPVDETQFPDPQEYLIAYLSSSLGKLLVDPAYFEEVVELLGLAPRTDGKYEVQEVSPEGEVRFFTFAVELIPAPELYFAAKDDMELDEEPRQVDGVWYRVWNNAECGETIRPKSGQCEELAQVDPQTGAVARQHKIEERHKRCKRGDGRCPEKLLPVGKTYFYDKLCRDEDTPDGNEVGTPTDFPQYRCDY